MAPILQFVIHARLGTTNELLQAAKILEVQLRHKAQLAGKVRAGIKAAKLGPVDASHYPLALELTVRWPRLKADVDNAVFGAAKVVLDSLVREGILADDSPKHLRRVGGTVVDAPRHSVLVQLFPWKP